MKDTLEVLVQWLDLKVPNWFALISGASLGILGVCALGFLVVVFAPDKSIILMPGVVLFCGISCGYKFWEKRQNDIRLLKIGMYLLAGLITAGVGIAIQYNLDRYLFQTQTPPGAILLLIVCGPLGAVLGVWLRDKYERLQQTGTNP